MSNPPDVNALHENLVEYYKNQVLESLKQAEEAREKGGSPVSRQQSEEYKNHAFEHRTHYST